MFIQLLLGILGVITVQKMETKDCYLRQKICASVYPSCSTWLKIHSIGWWCVTLILTFPVRPESTIAGAVLVLFTPNKRTISGRDFFSVWLLHNCPFKNNSPFKQLLLQNAKVNWILFLFSKELAIWRNAVTEQRQPWDSEFQYKLCQWLLDAPEKMMTLISREGDDKTKMLML